jgi:hypothetical protein
MKITITPTEKLISTDTIEQFDIPRLCRVWEGITASGAKCKLIIAGIAVLDTEKQTEFETELREFIPRERDHQVFDLRHIL